MTNRASHAHRAVSRDPRTSRAAVGLLLFAALMMFMVGMFQALTGLVAILDDEFFVATQDYLLKVDQTTWGWIHLILGLVIVSAGSGLLAGRTWARAVAVVLAVLSGVALFGFVPYFPLWAMLITALDVAVIWAVALHGREADMGR